MSDQPILFIIPGACSLGSQITLESLDIPYQIGITTPAIRASEQFKQINPTGKVGALIDGDFTIGENLAILLYLADKYPDKNLIGKIHSKERIKAYQWLSYLAATLHPAFSHSLYPERFIDAASLESFKQLAATRLTTTLSYIENELAKNNGFFVEDHLTIVDMQAYGLLRWTKIHRNQNNLVNLTAFPMILGFLNKMEALQQVQNALAIEQQAPQNILDSKFAGYFEFNNPTFD